MQLFLDERIVYVGKRVKNDIENVGDDFNVRPVTDKMRFADLATMATNRNIIKDRRTGLKDLVALIVNEAMSKDTVVRSSKWTKTALSVGQQEYAALDAIKSVQLYFTTREWPDYYRRMAPCDATMVLESISSR